MTSITLAGRLELQSNNGDGAQLLTEAAEFVNALAQMGVQLGVRIALAPVEEAPSPFQRVENDLGSKTIHARPVLDSVTLPAAGAAQRPYNKDDGRTFDTVPAVASAAAAAAVVEPPLEEEAEANPQPAAPARPDEPQHSFSTFEHALMQELDAGSRNFRPLPRPQRYELALLVGREMAAHLGYPPSMGEWNRQKPFWMPSASGLVKTTDWPMSWAAWQALFETTQGTLSGSSV